MVHITLFEINPDLSDSSLTANTPFSDRTGERDSSMAEDSSGSRMVPMLAALVVLALAGMAAKRMLGDSDLEDVDFEQAELGVET